MGLNELMQTIESHRFSAEVNLVAGAKAFRRALLSHASFGELLSMAKDPTVSESIAKRVVELTARRVDPEYENIFDAALSAYLMALSETAIPEVIAEAASAAAGARNCWWATGIAQELLIQALASGTVALSASSKASVNATAVSRHEFSWTAVSKLPDLTGYIEIPELFARYLGASSTVQRTDVPNSTPPGHVRTAATKPKSTRGHTRSRAINGPARQGTRYGLR